MANFSAPPLSRRQALKLIAGTWGGLAVSGLWPQGVWAKAAKKPLSPLNIPVADFSVQTLQVYEVINSLQETYHANICFIDAADAATQMRQGTDTRPDKEHPEGTRFYLEAIGRPTISFSIAKGTVKDVLNEIVKQDPAYCWSEVNGRIVVYPNQEKFRTVVKGVEIKNVRRLDAVDRFMAYLRANVPGFETYGAGPTGWGVSSEDPVYTSHVTLSQSGTILLLLTQLLGKDHDLAFSLTREVYPKYSYYIVPISWLQRAENGAAGKKGTAAEQFLKTSVLDLSLDHQDVYAVIQMLWDQYNIPISFIQAAAGQPVSLNIKSATVGDVLDLISRQDAAYRWQVIRDRIVLYPNEPQYDIVTTGLEIANVPRFEAVVKYTRYLRKAFPAFQKLGASYGYIGAVIIGGKHPTVTPDEVPISLSRTATVVQHFVELLGADKSAYFFITEDPWGRSMYQFNQVETFSGSTPE